MWTSWTGRALTNLGGIFQDFDENQKALDHYSLAVPLWRDLGDRLSEAATLSNIGAVHIVLGDYQKSLDHFSQALSHNRARETSSTKLTHSPA